MEKNEIMPPYEKNRFSRTYPETHTQTRPKKPRSSGKNPAVVTLLPEIESDASKMRMQVELWSGSKPVSMQE